ncbi:hypothetical protein BD309DRAFT_910316 [Dichomitus squalens]|nr:hypothetical protein BD309DRAFT_910316 [Dichomitus squalens]
MHALQLLSPINEVEELSPYQTRFKYARYPGQRSPIGPRSPYSVQGTPVGSKPEVSMDDLWIYDCYMSEDTVSPEGYFRTPTTPLHNRSISLPATTANFVPPNNVPLIKEPNAAHRPPTLSVPPRPGRIFEQDSMDVRDEVTDITAYTGDLPDINTAVFSPADFPEYSPLEQEVLSIWEVIDQLAAAADAFSGLENTLSLANPEKLPPEMNEDTLFWFVEALNMFSSDCADVAAELMDFSEFVEALLFREQQNTLAPVRTLPRASFSERDMKEVLESAANLPREEVAEALAALEVEVPPSSMGARRPRDRPPSLKLSTSDAVLLHQRLPRSRDESVGAVGRFSEKQGEVSQGGKEEVLRKHRAYVIYGDETSVEDNWSAKSIVDYGADDFPFDENGQPRLSPLSPRPRPTSGHTTASRPLSSPVVLGGPSGARRPPSLTFTDSQSPRSSHSTSSSVSSLFSNLPRSSFATTPSPKSSSRPSFTFDKLDKPRFPTSSGNIKKVFTNIFKKKEKEGGFAFPEKEKESRLANIGSSLRPNLAIRGFGRRTAGTGSIDATLSALSLNGPSSGSQTILNSEPDPFAATPPSSAGMPPSSSAPEPQTALDGYSSMFNPLKAASRYPTQPLFGGAGEELTSDVNAPYIAY